MLAIKFWRQTQADTETSIVIFMTLLRSTTMVGILHAHVNLIDDDLTTSYPRAATSQTTRKNKDERGQHPSQVLIKSHSTMIRPNPGQMNKDPIERKKPYPSSASVHAKKPDGSQDNIFRIQGLDKKPLDVQAGLDQKNKNIQEITEKSEGRATDTEPKLAGDDNRSKNQEKSQASAVKETQKIANNLITTPSSKQDANNEQSVKLATEALKIEEEVESEKSDHEEF